MKLARPLAAVAVVLALAGCGSSTPPKAAPAATSAATSAPSPTTPATSSAAPTGVPEVSYSPTEEDTPPPPEAVRFGQTWTWEDGTQVIVSKPQRFTPSEYAAEDGGGFRSHVVFTITVKNLSPTPLALMGTPSATSGDVEASTVFDSEKGVNGPPDTKVQPGRTVKFKAAFGVKDPSDIVMDYAPTFEHDAATFTSR